MLAALIPSIFSMLDKFIPDAQEKNRLANEIAVLAEKQAHEVYMAQIEVNKEDAKSASAFQSGWRPFIGWVCGIAFAYHFFLQPLILFVMGAYGHYPSIVPEFDMEALMTVLLGLLGLGGLRTFEKVKGITK